MTFFVAAVALPNAAESDMIAELAKLKITDPALRVAYERAFSYVTDELDRPLPDYIKAVVSDLRRRGEETIPLIIEIITDPNTPTATVSNAIGRIDGIDTLKAGNLSALTDSLRVMWSNRGASLQYDIASSIAWYLAKNGQANDAVIIDSINQVHPGDFIAKAKRYLIKRLNSPPITQPEKPSLPSTQVEQKLIPPVNLSPDPKPKVVAPSSPQQTSWIVWVIGGALCALILLFWFAWLRTHKSKQ